MIVVALVLIVAALALAYKIVALGIDGDRIQHPREEDE